MWAKNRLVSHCVVLLSAIPFCWQALDRPLDYLLIKQLYRDKSQTLFFKKRCCTERAVLTWRSTDSFILCFIIVLKRISAVCNICATLSITLINPSAIDVRVSFVTIWPTSRNLYLQCRILYGFFFFFSVGNLEDFCRKNNKVLHLWRIFSSMQFYCWDILVYYISKLSQEKDTKITRSKLK